MVKVYMCPTNLLKSILFYQVLDDEKCNVSVVVIVMLAMLEELFYSLLAEHQATVKYEDFSISALAQHA